MKKSGPLTRGQARGGLPIQLPDCPVCWDGFDAGAHTPRLLHCGHTICQGCLEHLFFDAGLGQRCVRCPECRSVCAWRALQELPKNYILLRVLSSSPPTHTVQSSCNGTPSIWTKVPVFLQVSHIAALATELVPRVVEGKLSDVAKVAWALTVMLIFLPLSSYIWCWHGGQLC